MLSKTRLQDEYNREIRTCDLFVMLYWTRVGQYTEEEFETAVGHFKASSKPFIFVYFKEAPQNDPSAATQNDVNSLQAFQAKLKDLGHFQTVYRNTEGLLHHFSRQLEKLAANGFIEFRPDQAEKTSGDGDNYRAHASGNSAIAQGEGAKAVAPHGAIVEGNNTGNITTGTQTHTDTGGGAYIGGNIQHVGGDFVGRDKIVERGR